MAVSDPSRPCREPPPRSVIGQSVSLDQRIIGFVAALVIPKRR
jgi:hypothetical protein